METVSTPAPIGSSAGVDINAFVKSGSIPALTAGSVPTKIQGVPVTTGVIVPSASSLEADMETVNNEFNPFIEEVAMPTSEAIPVSHLKVGTPPKGNGKMSK